MYRHIPINRVTVAPTLWPVTTAQVKTNAHIVSDTTYDEFIHSTTDTTFGLIPEATRYVEQLANRSLLTQTRVQYYDDLYEYLYFRYSPVQSITSITYKDSNEATQTLSSTLYTLDAKSYPARINVGYNDTYPTAICDTNSVAVTAVCGWTSAALVPVIYRRAVILMCTQRLYNRMGLACMSEQELQDNLLAMLSLEGATLEYA